MPHGGQDEEVSIFGKPDHLDFERSRISRQTAPFEVSAKFSSGGARYVRERKWSACDRLEEASDGTVVLTFQAQSELEVVKWILSFGREAELLRPAHLRERVCEELTDALGYYSFRDAQGEV